jgi:hypothetical protein
LQLPLCVSSSAVGLDGMTFKFTIGFEPSVTFRWWCELPEEWRALDPIIQEIHALSDGLKMRTIQSS